MMDTLTSTLRAYAKPTFGELHPIEQAHIRMMRVGSDSLLQAIKRARGEPIVLPRPVLAKHRINKPSSRKPWVPLAERPLSPVPEAARLIIGAAERAFNLPAGTVQGRDKYIAAVLARCLAARLLRDRVWQNGEPKHSSTTIGRYLNRDHSTICHALDRFEDYCRFYPEVREIYDRLSAEAACAA